MTLREAAEKALMALTFAEESGRHWPMAVKMARNAAIDALRAELAKPDAPLSAPLLRLGTSMSNLPPLGPHDHPEPQTMVWTELEMRAIRAYATAALAAQAAELEALRAKVAEWEKLRDPVTLHVSLLRGFPARLPRSVLLHLAGGDAPMPNDRANRPSGAAQE